MIAFIYGNREYTLDKVYLERSPMIKTIVDSTDSVCNSIDLGKYNIDHSVLGDYFDYIRNDLVVITNNLHKLIEYMGSRYRSADDIPKYYTHMYQVIYANDIEALTMLIDSDNVYIINPCIDVPYCNSVQSLRSAVEKAMESGHIDVVKLGMKYLAKHVGNIVCITYTLVYLRYTDMIKYIIDEFKCMDTSNVWDNEDDLLEAICDTGRLDIFKLLITDRDDPRVWHIQNAWLHEQLHIVDYILDIAGYTYPIHASIQYGCDMNDDLFDYIIERSNRYDVVDELMKIYPSSIYGLLVQRFITMDELYIHPVYTNDNTEYLRKIGIEYATDYDKFKAWSGIDIE